MKKLTQIRGVLKEKGIDGLLVTNALSLRYVTGFTGSTGVALITEEADPKLVDIYNIVHDALRLTLQEIRAGMTGKEAGSIPRVYITEKGYGEYFGYDHGHGTGLNIHENPFFSKNCEEVLQPDMVATIELGIYIPELGCVWIEDDVLLKADGI